MMGHIPVDSMGRVGGRVGGGLWCWGGLSKTKVKLWKNAN